MIVRGTSMDIPVLHIQLDTDGTPRTINRRVKVRMIAQKHLTAGESVEAIAEHYDITVADVYAALAYYYDNRASFEQHERELQPLIDEAQRYSDDLNAKIRQRLQQHNRTD
jgi:uncharacterized protein (DUF433 family)